MSTYIISFCHGQVTLILRLLKDFRTYNIKSLQKYVIFNRGFIIYGHR